jgi:uncharacterized membrane protein
MNPAVLSAQLRSDRSPSLTRRRAVVSLSLLAEAALGVISLYQMGIVRHVPEPPRLGFNGDHVNSSPDAYRWLGMPDGVLGIGSHALTLALAAAGGSNRSRDKPWLPLALLGKVTLDTLVAIQLTWHQATRDRAFCLWCLLTSACSLASLPLAIPEARTALGQIRRRNADTDGSAALSARRMGNQRGQRPTVGLDPGSASLLPHARPW